MPGNFFGLWFGKLQGIMIFVFLHLVSEMIYSIKMFLTHGVSWVSGLNQSRRCETKLSFLFFFVCVFVLMSV